jgi:hypothetical protein
VVGRLAVGRAPGVPAWWGPLHLHGCTIAVLGWVSAWWCTIAWRWLAILLLVAPIVLGWWGTILGWCGAILLLGIGKLLVGVLWWVAWLGRIPSLWRIALVVTMRRRVSRGRGSHDDLLDLLWDGALLGRLVCSVLKRSHGKEGKSRE